MNRRNFLKSCGLLPLAGALSIVSDSGASKGHCERCFTPQVVKDSSSDFYYTIYLDRHPNITINTLGIPGNIRIVGINE